MTRFLVVVPPLTGHVNPAAGIAAELAARGHEVAWTGTESVLRPLLGPGARVFGTGTRAFRAQGGHGLAALRSLWEGFIVPYARFTAKPLDTAVREYRPEVLLVDQHTPAGALVAHRHGLPWASFAPGAMELGRPYRALPQVEAWMTGLLRGLWERARLPEAEYVDPRFSPALVLATTGPALTGPVLTDGGAPPVHHAMVGPVIAARPPDPAFPWERLLPGRQRVLVTMGTLAGELGADFLARAVRAPELCGEEVQPVFAAPRALLPELPPHAVAVDRVPVLELMARGELDAVLCHGGMNTVGEALAHGLPLVTAPIRHDQPFVAAQVAAAGVGLQVPFARVTPERLAAGLRTVLETTAYRDRAVQVGRELLAGGGAVAAADRLEALG
ncbi:UDP:flavonoid glycosyltransferase YjiC (YdhE family) [Streptomyces sp. 1114.5]|uniref:glycosyltransferase n=1 Tax=Streptomyces sp. 1114.5 TaxID=1938830 RepID=UPI000EB405A4|nr:glycosyltransferase [Streptomyces sp. 1114.5]RKT08811.1 UDP:flavonoid glycosyltransferase YjiC (YdhE family) [Streptomyces sp. 1114.5]